MKLSDCTFCLPSFSGGGAERVFANLISEFVHRDQYQCQSRHLKTTNNGKKGSIAVDANEAIGLTDCGKSYSVTCIQGRADAGFLLYSSR